MKLLQRKKKNVDEVVPSEDSDKPMSEEVKRSFVDKIFRLLIVTDLTPEELKPDLVRIKDDMYKNFSQNGVRWSDYVNNIFWLYANKDQDIVISKPHLKLFSKQIVTISDVPQEEQLKVPQYIKTLKFIRARMNPLMQNIKYFISIAKDHGVSRSNWEHENIPFNTAFDKEAEIEFEKKQANIYAHEHFKKSMETVLPGSQQKYDWDRFQQEQILISDTFDQNNYQDLMIFAFLWFHYFDQKNAVYDAFMEEKLHSIKITFTAPWSKHPTDISLYAFLKIIEKLNFKKHLFVF